jgi:hypothetical protein
MAENVSGFPAKLGAAAVAVGDTLPGVPVVGAASAPELGAGDGSSALIKVSWLGPASKGGSVADGSAVAAGPGTEEAGVTAAAGGTLAGDDVASAAGFKGTGGIKLVAEGMAESCRGVDI